MYNSARLSYKRECDFMDSNNKKYWWLVKTKTRQDEKAELNLNKQDYITYRPEAKRLRKFRGKMKERIESLFPGYIFIQLDLTNDDWAPIRSTYGVSHIIRFGNKPAMVPDKLIDEIKQKQDPLAKKLIDLDRYKKGDKVIIDQEGAFKGMEGIFQNYDGEQRALILLSILQSQSVLALSEGEISAIS